MRSIRYKSSILLSASYFKKLEARNLQSSVIHRVEMSNFDKRSNSSTRSVVSRTKSIINKNDLLGFKSNNKKLADLTMLDKGIKKTNEISSMINDYKFKITTLPPDFGSNQSIEVDDGLEKELRSIIDYFQAPIDFAFGYGSGVFQQAGYDNTNELPQIDLIFGVTDPVLFHKVNIKQNPHHYSSMKLFGSEWIATIQDFGAGIYFNPFAEINGRQVKYGVVSMDKLLKDLSQWDTFYLAGRLQKPVKFLKNNLDVTYWNQKNLRYAATLAKYLTLKKNNGKFDDFQFYKEITGLSYMGDIRYKLGGENPNKINNIVTKNLEYFKEYYRPIYEDVVINGNNYLPQGYTFENSLRLLKDKIAESSGLQTAKGILTAGIIKSAKYAWNKKVKAWKKQ